MGFSDTEAGRADAQAVALAVLQADVEDYLAGDGLSNESWSSGADEGIEEVRSEGGSPIELPTAEEVRWRSYGWDVTTVSVSLETEEEGEALETLEEELLSGRSGSAGLEEEQLVSGRSGSAGFASGGDGSAVSGTNPAEEEDNSILQGRSPRESGGERGVVIPGENAVVIPGENAAGRRGPPPAARAAASTTEVGGRPTLPSGTTQFMASGFGEDGTRGGRGRRMRTQF